MAEEIERKFLVTRDTYQSIAEPRLISQAYLNSAPERTTRVRISGDDAWLTIKSKNQGIQRQEFEYVIPKADAEALIALAEPGAISKYRYCVPIGNHIWEVDEFLGDNLGLIVAEIELSHIDEAFEKPDWIGEEVSGDDRYYNSALSRRPFKDW
ncbi:Inorganic triphosphatase [BD1-7 clade bacterium]|uniref:Inorganic triphosphatase n=1 Tax=BD1-7 clade bacterium TaxID=2029982 RepID=A0A5S9QEQ3_9GAMM|nr:Inorganic triphosphatase [BD1-7 clade bacterium]CAA0116390.1 Inorganic triphosphatase [BD1-7 clade bacterium]